jgi:hypothetical protein
LIYQDPHAKQVTGQIVRNTLANQPPTPTIGSTLNQDSSGNVTGAITTDLSRHFIVEGYVNTSAGRIDTTVNQTVSFADTQTFNITSSFYGQISQQLTKVDGVSRSTVDGFLSGEFDSHYRYPLNVNVGETFDPSGNISIVTTVKQGYDQKTALGLGGLQLYSAEVHNHVNAGDTLQVNSSFEITGHSGQYNTQDFTFQDSLGGCYSRSVGVTNDTVSAYSNGKGCPGQQNRLFWFSHPDGSPYQGETFLGW